LEVVNLFFNGVFVIQHFVLYRPVGDGMLITTYVGDNDTAGDETHDSECRPLLRP
jgi:hypothetical protein